MRQMYLISSELVNRFSIHIEGWTFHFLSHLYDIFFFCLVFCPFKLNQMLSTKLRRVHQWKKKVFGRKFLTAHWKQILLSRLVCFIIVWWIASGASKLVTYLLYIVMFYIPFFSPQSDEQKYVIMIVMG
jgi:hypothetical protein